MNTLTITSAAFAEYGRLVEGIPTRPLMDILLSYPLPPSGMIYTPREDDLHARLDFTPWGERLFADMPYQLGWCGGSNDRAEVLVRHGGSAFLQSTVDIDLLLAHRWEKAPRRFRIPADTLIELYGDTLRSAPLGRDFRVLALLPYATNTDWRGEDGVTARNTWSVFL